MEDERRQGLSAMPFVHHSRLKQTKVGVTSAGAGHPISETLARKVTRAETKELGAH